MTSQQGTLQVGQRLLKTVLLEPTSWHEKAWGPDRLSHLQPHPHSAATGIAQGQVQGLRRGHRAGPILRFHYPTPPCPSAVQSMSRSVCCRERNGKCHRRTHEGRYWADCGFQTPWWGAVYLEVTVIWSPWETGLGWLPCCPIGPG